jgi:hypothetical protein
VLVKVSEGALSHGAAPRVLAGIYGPKRSVLSNLQVQVSSGFCCSALYVCKPDSMRPARSRRTSCHQLPSSPTGSQGQSTEHAHKLTPSSS